MIAEPTQNRAQRRAAMKQRLRAGRRRPKPITLDTVVLATARATRCTPAEIQSVMAPTREAFTALRQGVASELQWAILAGGVSTAKQIERQGIVRGYAGHLKAAEDALQGIYLRAMVTGAWRATALYWAEIDAIDEFVSLHKFQLEQLSNAEVRAAIDKAFAVIQSQRGAVIDLGGGRQNQLQLIGEAA